MKILRGMFWVLLAACQAPQGGGSFDTEATPVTPHPDVVQSLGSGTAWERANTTIYHLWVAAFADSNGDGTGDLGGITAQIDAGYFHDLGITTLWLSPIFRAASLTSSSGNKHGYDTIDYDAIAPLFGTKDDLASLLTHAHTSGLRVIFDFVPNHTSDQNPWFTSIHKDWYVRSDAQPSGWNGFDGSSDWYGSGPYYYAVFGSSMPDLDYRNAEVRKHMRAVVSQWLDFGFDGLRVDAVKYLVEGDSPGQFKDQPETHTFFDNLRADVLDPYAAAGYAKFMIAENWEGDMTNVRSYLNNSGKPEFNLALDFIWPYVLRDNLNAAGVSSLLGHLVGDSASLPDGSGYGVFQSNHDNVVDRPATMWSTDHDRLRLAAALSMLGRGTPIVYYGNEIGMTGAAGNDTNLRQTFSWSSAAAQQADAASLWTWHSELLNLRSHLAAFRDPTIQSATTSSGTLAMLLTGSGGAKALVVANLTSAFASPSVTVPVSFTTAKTVFGTDETTVSGNQLTLAMLAPLSVRVLALDDAQASVYRDNDTQLYLRGSMTTSAWDASVPFVDQGSGVLKATFTSASSTPIQFKFGSETWLAAWPSSSVTYDTTVVGAEPDSSFGTSGSPDENITFTPSAAATYEVYFDLPHQKYWVLTVP